MITLDRWGRVGSVVHDDRPDLSYLRGVAVERVVRADDAAHPTSLSQPRVLADSDEIEFVYTDAADPGSGPARGDGLRIVVRHTFGAGWGVRIAVTNLGENRQDVDCIHWSLSIDDPVVGWVLAAGAEASYSVHPADGAGPVLGGVLQLGSVRRATRDGLELGPLHLSPGARYVVQWRWDWFASPLAFGRDRHPDVPERAFQLVGEPATVAFDDDVAVIVPSGVEVVEAGDRRDLVADQAGRHLIEVHSARGQTTFELAWVDPVDQCLAVAAAVALSRPRTSANVIKLGSIHEALVVQDALGPGGGFPGLDDPDEAAEALDLFTARLVGNHLEPVHIRYLGGEYARTADPDLLLEATQAVLTHPVIAPGLGLAVAQLSVAALLAGKSIERLLEHALSLLSRQADDARSVVDQAAVVELAAVLATRGYRRRASPPARPVDLMPRVAALGVRLGAGLKGRPVRLLPVGDLGQLIAVLPLVPESVSARFEPIWGRTAHVLAREATPELLARLTDGSPVDAAVGPAHSWLIAARPTH